MSKKNIFIAVLMVVLIGLIYSMVLINRERFYERAFFTVSKIAYKFNLFQGGKLEYLNGKPVLKVRISNYYPNLHIDHLKELYHIIQERYSVIKVSPMSLDYDLNVDSMYDNFNYFKNPNNIHIFYTFEAEYPRIRDFDLSLGFNFIDTQNNYMRIPYYYLSHGDKINSSYKRGKCNPKAKKNFACMLVTNAGGLNWHNGMRFDGADVRNNLFHKLSQYKPVLSGGRHLNNIGKMLPYSETEEWLNQCKFIFAQENQKYNGYITEKLFNAYYGGGIPIYYADQSTLKDFNKDAVIWHDDFANEDELIEYIKKVDQDDDLYCDIWNQPILTNPEQDYKVVRAKLAAKIYEVIDRKLEAKYQTKIQQPVSN